MTDETDPNIREQVTIMVLTTVVAFASVFGCMALLLLGWMDIADGSLSPRAVFALPLSFGLALWAGHGAMLLVCRPTRHGTMVVLARACAAVVPVLALEIL